MKKILVKEQLKLQNYNSVTNSTVVTQTCVVKVYYSELCKHLLWASCDATFIEKDTSDSHVFHKPPQNVNI